MTTNRIRPLDDIRIEIYYGDRKVDTYQTSGDHTVEQALAAAIEGTRLTAQPEDYVYRVTNLTTGTAARYRINAGGHIRILPEAHPE